jgi:hypothetical protein
MDTYPVIIAPCRGCAVHKTVTDQFDGTLCAPCRSERGLLRPEESPVDWVAYETLASLPTVARIQ